MKSTKVLITGGAGFIGKRLSNYLSGKGFGVLIIDDLSTGNLKEINKNIRFEKINILNKNKLKLQFGKFKPDYVFHLAALNTRSAGADRDLLNVNIQGTHNILECIEKNQVKKFIFSSSAAVYGNARVFPTPEGVELKPLNLYGMSKLASEVLIKSAMKDLTIPYSVLRFSNVYGPEQRFDNEGGVVSIFCNNIKNKQESVVFGDGQQTRDFIFIDDVIEVLYRSMLYKESFIANVSTQRESSINGLVDLLRLVTKKAVEVEHKPPLKDEIRRSVLDNLKIKKLLSLTSLINLRDGISLTYKAN